MPTYEYQCDACQARFELRQAISAPPAETCPTCGGHVERLISGGAGFIIKGSEPGSSQKAGTCSLEQTGQTCCGRAERCGHSHCEE